jgi:hypothetical protein
MKIWGPLLKNYYELVQAQWLKPIIPATRDVEIRRMAV